MKKSSFDLSNEGFALLNSGKFRDALLKTALTAEQKIGKDEKSIVAIRLCIIACHHGLEEVSLAEHGSRKADDFDDFLFSA